MWNQEAGLGRCFAKAQNSMATCLEVIQSDRPKGKSASKVHEAAEELDYLVTFNRSITQAMAQTVQDLSEGVFMANLTLAHLIASLANSNSNLTGSPVHLPGKD